MGDVSGICILNCIPCAVVPIPVITPWSPETDTPVTVSTGFMNVVVPNPVLFLSASII